ncbi:MAG: class II glutamine amidotransferase [Candidatus Helarchaeota archaeon]|nr:class II glutamine amidotransferase [Candidatus Helarchaeota archaeon]
MCELLAVSCNKKNRIKDLYPDIYLEFRSHSVVHKDGWGIAFYEPRTFNVIKEAKPAFQSNLSKFMAKYVKSHLIIAHIRKASRGKVNLRNTHPFQRELFGKSWVFAHNGTVFERPELRNFKLLHYFPIGTTDSELAFCYILDKLKEKGYELTFEQKIKSITDSVKSIDVGAFGFNFLMSDSQNLYVYRGRRGPILHYINLLSEDSNKLIIISTKKLRRIGVNKLWIRMKRGQFLTIKEGSILQDLKLK